MARLPDRHLAYARATLAALCNELASMAPETGRNIALNNAALKMGHMIASGWIERSEVEQALTDAALACGLLKGAIAATLRSGIEAGLQTPHDELPDRPRIEPTPKPQAAPSIQARSNSGKFFSAKELNDMHFEPIKYVVPGIIVEGLTLLAGKPKIGKSWLLLHAAIAVARGGFTLGDIHCTEGDVLYCALEDNLRRLQSRMTKLLGTQDGPQRLFFRCEMPRLTEGGLDQIKDWIKAPTIRAWSSSTRWPWCARPRSATRRSYDADYAP